MATSPAIVPRARRWQVALVGNPNCGKTALFNLLTGSRQKVANYAGVTVERKSGSARLAGGGALTVLDLPGAYSLAPSTPDEQVMVDAIAGNLRGDVPPDIIVAVVDATNLRMNLRLVLELKRLGRPIVVALNMADVAKANGLAIDVPRLSAELGLPVVETVAVKRNGHMALLAKLEALLAGQAHAEAVAAEPAAALPPPSSPDALHAEVRRILAACAPNAARVARFQHRIDAVVMQPVLGLALLAVVLLLMFQAVFSWATLPMDAIKEAVAMLGQAVTGRMAEGPLRSLIVDGVIAGLGSVLVFLPQILILFFFILALEDSGYLPRAAFLLDNVMGKVGLSGRAFIPLLSSFACAIPGIMATRSIPNPRDRLTTIMIAPLMTCSARLPVYALLIGAFVPGRSVGPFNLQGLTLFALYVAGVVSAMAVAWVLKRGFARASYQPLLLELPPYRWPSARNLLLGLWQRAWIFMRRVGTIIFSLTVILWFLSTYPAAPEGATGAAIQYSFAGQLGRVLEVVFAPVGFNWQIAIALVPGLAAREVAVSALGTVYALSATGEDVADALAPMIAQTWSVATAYALIAWYVFAPQCLSTLAVVKRETNTWRYPLLMAAYLFALAYAAAFVTYRVTLWIGG